VAIGAIGATIAAITLNRMVMRSENHLSPAWGERGQGQPAAQNRPRPRATAPPPETGGARRGTERGLAGMLKRRAGSRDWNGGMIWVRTV